MEFASAKQDASSTLFCDVAQYKEIVAFDEGLFFSFKEVIEFIPHLCSQNKDLQALQARAPYAPLPHTHTKHAHTRGRE